MMLLDYVTEFIGSCFGDIDKNQTLGRLDGVLVGSKLRIADTYSHHAALPTNQARSSERDRQHGATTNEDMRQ